ncbi:MAG: hypothetical protein CVV42_07545 [Candidatus Riflebacteria bacterium HGW-Riflebacteria-2]|nr:MAG: hypothetical protein CVV42_07545 [Candidatus Riflebacteria bacterium HGW-Riflebacteria-2]
MNKDCERVVNLLAEDEITSEDGAFIDAHSAKCACCRELLSSYSNLTTSLQSAVSLPDADKNRVFLRLRSRLTIEQKTSDSSSGGFLSWFVGDLRLSLALMAAVIMIVAALAWQGDTGTTFYQATGSGKMLLARGEVSLGSDPVPLKHGMPVKLLQGQISLNWQGNEQMTIAGNLSFTPEDRIVRVENGSASVDFLPSAAGYQIFTAKLVLTIVGTSINLNISKDSETVTVTKGRIQWQVLATKQKGDLAAGSSLRIDHTGKVVVEKVAFEPAANQTHAPRNETPAEAGNELPGGEIREPELYQDQDLSDQ